MIDTRSWKKFHLYDDCMFKIDMGTKLDKAKMKELHPSINFIGRANANNGITSFADRIDGIEPYPAGYMTLSLGGEYLGSCFIQPKPFYTSQNVIVLIPNKNMTDYVKQFISTVIFRTSRLKYKAFIDELNRHIKTDFEILLPVDSIGQPNWDYMNSYMKSVITESEKNLHLLQDVKGTKHFLETSKWGVFSCKELFDCKNTGNILARDVEDGSGETPYVTASAYNNGVVGYIDASKYEIIKGHCILVGGKTFTITYQKDDFVSNDSHNFVIRVREYEVSDLVYLYLVSTIYSYFGQKYSWDDAVTKPKFLEESIPLPQTSSGDPDWKYMEDYMKKIMDKAENTIKTLTISYSSFAFRF